MSFEQRERSLADGQPIRLYQFARGVVRWAYNSSDRDVVYRNQVFKSLRGGISDEGIIQSGDPQADKFIVSAPADLEVAQMYRGAPPSDEVSLTVFDMHFGDADAAVSWVGAISDVDWPQSDRCRITCLSEEVLMDQPGLTDTYCRTCTAILGDVRCKVDMNLHRVEVTPQSISAKAVTSGTFAAYADGWFSAGYVEWALGDGNYERRHIERHAGSDLVILGGTQGVPSGVSLRVYPGCDFLIETCQGKFANQANFRGINKLQGKSPFDGDQVW